MTPARRIRLARQWLDAEPQSPDAQREMAAAIREYHREYETLRDVCERINCQGGDA